jgi:hypothetical protein
MRHHLRDGRRPTPPRTHSVWARPTCRIACAARRMGGASACVVCCHRRHSRYRQACEPIARPVRDGPIAALIMCSNYFDERPSGERRLGAERHRTTFWRPHWERRRLRRPGFLIEAVTLPELPRGPKASERARRPRSQAQQAGSQAQRAWSPGETPHPLPLPRVRRGGEFWSVAGDDLPHAPIHVVHQFEAP